MRCGSTTSPKTVNSEARPCRGFRDGGLLSRLQKLAVQLIPKSESVSHNWTCRSFNAETRLALFLSCKRSAQKSTGTRKQEGISSTRLSKL